MIPGITPSPLIARFALEIAEAEHALRFAAHIYGADPGAAIERAVARSRTTTVTLVRALDEERWAMGDNWMRDQ